MLLTFSSILSMATFEVFSMSRRMVTLAEARGMRTVRMQAFRRYIVLVAGRKLIMYERSGSFLAVSCVVAISFALKSVSF